MILLWTNSVLFAIDKLPMDNCLYILLYRLKMESLVPAMFRMSDQNFTEQESSPAQNAEVKIEPDTDSSNDSLRCSEESDQVESNKTPKFVDVKNHYIFDFDSTAKTSTISNSSWPQEWLTAVESKYRLRRNEAAKKFGLYEELRQLLKDAIEV